MKFGLSLAVAVAFAANASASTYSLGYDVAQKTSTLDAKKEEVKNTLTSPLSLHIALSMATNGASKDTLKLLLSKLDATSLRQLNAANASVLKLLKKSVPADWPEHRAKPPTLTVSNSAWRTNGATDKRKFVFEKTFADTLTNKNIYNATIGVEDFKTKKAADAINAWVTTATNNMITEIIDQDGLEPLLWAIINAVYLEGSWTKPFIPKTTRNFNFTKVDGKGLRVNMMTKEDNYKHAQTKLGEAIELPLAQSELALVAVLPPANSEFSRTGDATSAFDQALWTDVLETLGKAEYEKGTLDMPKFKYTYGYEMNPDSELTDLTGLKHIFTNAADFSKMGTRDSLPSKVALLIQKTAIEVDENGLKAAAVTFIGGAERTSMPRPPTFAMELNRPFVYAIVDRQTNAVLFLGSVVDPTK